MAWLAYGPLKELIFRSPTIRIMKRNFAQIFIIDHMSFWWENLKMVKIEIFHQNSVGHTLK